MKDLAKEAKLVVSEASEIIKNKINTIFFENQRLNQEMVNSVKKLEEIKFDIGIKYKEIASAYDLLLESKQNIEDLRDVIALYKEFENDVISYSEIIKDFKNKIENLEQDLNSKSENIHTSLDDKQNEILKNLDDVKNEALTKFDELTAKYEGYKVHFEQSYDRFNERALIADENLGRLAEVAKKELGDDKLIYETELKALRDEIISTMNEISNDLSNEKNEALFIFDNKKQEFITLVDTSKIMIDNLNNIFNTNYQEKKNEFNLLFNEKLYSLGENTQDFLNELEVKKESGLNEINETKEQNLNVLEIKKDECIDNIDNQAKIYDISGIKANVEYIFSLMKNDENEEEQAKEDIKDLEQDLSQKVQELENIKNQIEETLRNDEILQNKKEELEELKKQIDEALVKEPPEDTSELEKQKDELEQEITQIEQELTSDLISKKEELEQEITKRQEDLENKQDELEQIQEDKSLVTKRMLDEEVAKLDDKLENEINKIDFGLSDKVSNSENEEIVGSKTFVKPILVSANPTNDNHLTNKAYVDTALNKKANLNEDNVFNGANIFNQVLIAPTNPTNDNHLTRKWYVDYGGGIKNLGATGSINLDLRQAQHFILTMTARGAIGIANWASAGKSGTITVNNAQNITAFSAPFRFRIAQSGFSGTETFAYFCIASNNVRLVRT
ncbi:TPA: hypothetical protein RTG00_001382 [Campylobacter jejuni]|nr:hypothetical protein [Campylobacter jejuni]